MNSYVLFQMPPNFREELIEKHEFYVHQAKKRIIEQFTDHAIKEEANQTAEESWRARGQNFNPDYHDPGDFAEDAYEDGVWRYQLLCDLRDNVRLNIIAGLFHRWEKDLRQWLANEIQRWHRGNEVKDKIWKTNFENLFDLLESFGWNLKKSNWFADIDACRLVVNVHKHGDGPSLQNLHREFPSFLVDPHSDITGSTSLLFSYYSHNDLKVSDNDLDVFANAIKQFWLDLPDEVVEPQISDPPKWLTNAIEKDRAAAKSSPI